MSNNREIRNFIHYFGVSGLKNYQLHQCTIILDVKNSFAKSKTHKSKSNINDKNEQIESTFE